MPSSAEVVIIGGGITGCSIAYHLTQAGLCDVIILEKEGLACGATGICPGGIRQQFEGQADCLMARRSVRFWEEVNQRLEPEAPFEFERSGYLFLAESPRLLERFRANVALQNRLGIPSEILSPEQISRLLPALRLDGILGGSFCAEDGFLEDCHGITALLARRASQRGARILYQQAVDLKAAPSGWRISAGHDVIEAGQVVLAAGADSVPLAECAGVKLPIRPEVRRLAFTLPYPTQLMTPLVVFPEREFAGKQLSYGVFYLGWLAEDPLDDDLLFIEKGLLGGATLLPILEDLPVRKIIRGTYDTTPDQRPLLGAVPNREGLWVAAGFSGHGFMIAPAVGEALSCAIRGEETDLPLEAFSLLRFQAQGQREGLFI